MFFLIERSGDVLVIQDVDGKHVPLGLQSTIMGNQVVLTRFGPSNAEVALLLNEAYIGPRFPAVCFAVVNSLHEGTW